MIPAGYHKPALFCCMVVLSFVGAVYLGSLDKISLIHGLFLPLRAIIAASIFFYCCKRFLMPDGLGGLLNPLDWFVYSLGWLVVMMAVTIMLFIFPLTFYIAMGVAYFFELIGISMSSIHPLYTTFAVIAGVIGGACLWAMFKEALRLPPEASRVWRRYILGASIACSLLYLYAALEFEKSCVRNSCAYQDEISALVFIALYALFLLSCFRAWHLTKQQIIEALSA